jgi:hypothetical protein
MPGDYGGALWNGGLDRRVDGMLEAGTVMSRLAGKSFPYSRRPSEKEDISALLTALAQRLQSGPGSQQRRQRVEQWIRAAVQPPVRPGRDLLDHYRRQSYQPHSRDVHLRDFAVPTKE